MISNTNVSLWKHKVRVLGHTVYMILQMSSYLDAGWKKAQESKLQLSFQENLRKQPFLLTDTAAQTGCRLCPLQSLCFSCKDVQIVCFRPGGCIKGWIGGRGEWQCGVEEGEEKGYACVAKENSAWPSSLFLNIPFFPWGDFVINQVEYSWALVTK